MARYSYAAWLLVCLAAAPVNAQTERAPADSWVGTDIGTIDRMERFPANGFQIVEIKGRMMLLSTNFQYVVIPERIVDGWNELEVTSWQTMDASRRLPFSRIIGDRVGSMGTVLIGDAVEEGAAVGVPEVVIFLDAYGTDTPQLLSQVQPLLGQYAFRFIWIPVGQQTAEQNRAFVCSPELAEQYVRGGKVDGGVLQKAVCETDRAQINLVTAKILGITKVPTILPPNERPHVGVPPQLATFLAENGE